MMWQPYEKQRIGTLDAVLAEDLDAFLDQRESKLGLEIIAVAQHLHGAPALEGPSEYVAFRLHEAVEDFGRRVHRAAQVPHGHLISTGFEPVVEQLNKVLWYYTETLEGCATELFQQLNQIGFEYWDIDLFQVVGEIKDGLTHRLQDLIWTIRRLEHQLIEYRSPSGSGGNKGLRTWFSSWRKVLDPSLESTVAKCLKFLGFRYQKFAGNYNGFLQLYTQAEQTLKKFNQYRALSSMGSDIPYRFKKLYLLLRLWELNGSAKVLVQNDFIRSLRGMVSSEDVLVLFKDYYTVLRTALFDKGRMIKKGYRTVFQDQDVRKYIIENIVSYRSELHTLAATIARYRDFLLRTDPDPYVRSRWGFPEWIVGQEPKASRHLQSLVYDIEHLDALYGSFLSSLQATDLKMQTLTPKTEKNIEGHLHEMGQPLASKEIMYRHAKTVVTALKELDELGSFQTEVVGYICRILCRVMRADWKYHVAQDIADFHYVYEVHQGLVTPVEDRQHVHRMQKFVRLLGKLEQRLASGKTVKYANDIELDVNDIRAYLQDFLAQVQRLKRSENEHTPEVLASAAANMQQTLLEYRYLFSKFFHSLSHAEPEQRLMRNQLLFVDQYFEAIEDCMLEICLSH
jgi:hypothetical protein